MRLMIFWLNRKRLVEILNSGAFEPPMIVFVNQKKAADVLMKDLARAHVRPFLPLVSPSLMPHMRSGTSRHCIRERIKNSEKQR